MRSVASESAVEPLIFSWDSPRRRKLAITIFVALSFLAHALCFYVFQIVYPPMVALLPPPARITLITAASEQGRTLLRWIDSEDPALAFTTHRPDDAMLAVLPKAQHVPSYSIMEPTLKDIPSLHRDVGIPTCQPPGPVLLPRKKNPPTIGVVKTSIWFSNDFDAFGAPVMPEQNFTSPSDQTPEGIRFRVAVNGLGEVRYCLPVNSSGDPALDEQARLYVVRCRFPEAAVNSNKADSFLAWGVATIEWGNNIAHAQRERTSRGP